MSDVDPQRPVVRGRACIIHTSLEVHVLWKQQLKKAIDWLIEHDYEFDWEVVIGDSLTPDKFTLTVHDIAWANNLVEFAQVLESCDYHRDIIPD